MPVYKNFIKLLKISCFLKNEIDNIDAENQRQKEEINQFQLKSAALHKYNDELDYVVKGMKEKIIAAGKKKINLMTGIRDYKTQVESTSRKIDRLKIDNNYKVKMIRNDTDHISNVKENTVKSLKKKIEAEEKLRSNINENIEELMAEIQKYKNLISEIDEQDSQRTKTLSKETADMAKFLSEL